MFRIQDGVDPPELPVRAPTVRAGSFYGAACICGVLAVALALLLVPRGIHGLSGRIGAGVEASVGVHRGQPGDFTGWLANHSGQTVTLESATLLRAHGLRGPRYVGAAVETSRGFLGADRGWPPTGAREARVSLAPLRGFRLRNGRRAQILYSIRAARVGDYAAGGVAVTVRSDDSTTVVPVLSVGGICVTRGRRPACDQAFQQRLHHAAG